MTDLTRYRRLPGYSTVGTDNTLPPGSYSSAVADWVPDSTLQDIAAAYNTWKNAVVHPIHPTHIAETREALDALLDALENQHE